jgi:hypothetical protein
MPHPCTEARKTFLKVNSGACRWHRSDHGGLTLRYPRSHRPAWCSNIGTCSASGSVVLPHFSTRRILGHHSARRVLRSGCLKCGTLRMGPLRQALGPSIRDHHLSRAQPVGSRLRVLDATSDTGAEYLHDASCARRFADASRRAMAEEVGRVLAKTLGAQVRWDTVITTDHNHVSLEHHGGRDVWVHRKGAMSAQLGERGVLPGSMGSVSFHVEGRGHEEALCSSAHGAGRVLSRTTARQQVTARAFSRQMEGVWYDTRKMEALRDEAPAAYKDIHAVLRAQKEMVKVIRTLRPLLNYKGV